MQFLEKNAILEAETMDFGRKTMNLRQSPARSPISNWEAAQICQNDGIWLKTMNHLQSPAH